MLALGAAATAGEYYLNDARLGTGTAPLLLLSRADIRAELKLTPAQGKAAEAAIDSLYTRAEALIGRGNTPEVVAERRKIDDAERAWIIAKLNPDQQARLTQLALQWEGPASLVTRRLVAESLGLEPVQRATLTQAYRACRKVHASGDAKAAREAERAFAKTALETLNETQRERWASMLGAPFTPRLADAGKAPTTATR